MYKYFERFVESLEGTDAKSEDHDGSNVEDGKLSKMVEELDKELEERHGEDYRLVLDYLESFVEELEASLAVSDMGEGQKSELKGIVEMAYRKAVSRTHNEPSDDLERGSSEGGVEAPKVTEEPFDGNDMAEE